MNKIVAIFVLLFLGACAQLVPPPRPPSGGHLRPDTAQPVTGDIPRVVEEAPVLPPPRPEPPAERYTVVVNEVPVKELLFAIARDANMNVDINPSIDGVVTLNAVDQTMRQILDRIADQVALRYEVQADTIVVMPDTPFFRSYAVNFLNMSRDTRTTVTVLTQIETGGDVNITGTGGGGGGSAGRNNSTTDVTSTSYQRFWGTLVSNVMAIVGEEPEKTTTGGELPVSKSVVASPETGVLSVLATSRQHEQIQKLLDEVLASAERQVLVEATIVEVTLSDRYRSGIDWRALTGDFDIQSSLLAGDLGTAPFFGFSFFGEDFSLTLRLLREFGDVQVLSSPKLMVLNNQTALLKVVDNIVFFTIDVETNTTQGVVSTTFDTTPHTVPVGLVMSVTPQINANDAVMLNVRPTISRRLADAFDPNPALAQAGVRSAIPVIQTRELESMLKVHSGQIAVLGGLMQDSLNAATQGIPGLQDTPVFGELFKHRDNQYAKTELVIFLRPTVIKNPSIDGDFDSYRQFLSPQPDLDLAPSPDGRKPPCYRDEPGCNPNRRCYGPWCQ
ncbi:MAG: secretin N-terminal domain-containing protein [Chromatiales bacterium]